MDPTLGMMLVSAVAGAAAWTVTLWWLREPQPAPSPPLLSPMDGEPHTITMLGPDGRPNPLRYERLPNYPAALARQRELSRRGVNSIIAHAESGQIRMDIAAWLGPYARLGL